MKELSMKLMAWYRQHRRDLPWRQTRDPYRVWVSEIILQQTRVEQGLEYYLRFVEQFPDIPSLACADVDEVMKAWQGLGYYTRARNMQAAARRIMAEFGGRFPSSCDQILTLEGIGPYTAAAIASICFGEATPVVDGNVIRFLSRLSGVTAPAGTAAGKQQIRSLAGRMIDREHPGDFNQALMEFGALYCKPLSPDCNQCVFKKECAAFKTGRVNELPAKSKKAIVTSRYFNYLVARYTKGDKEYYFLKKREGQDIWKGMYEFPLIETEKPVSAARLVQSEEWERLFRGTGAVMIGRGKVVKHQLSHRMIHARFYDVILPKPLKGDYMKVRSQDLELFPVSRLIERYFFTTETRRHGNGS
jgi:A/G-specific adenine glycosylase